MSLSDADIDVAIARYTRELDRYQKLTDLVAEECRAIVRDNTLPATVQWRTKGIDSLRGKLQRKREQYDSPDDVFIKLGDLAAVRIATYVESDRPRVVAAIVERFDGKAGEVEPEEKDREPPSFYRATHCQVWLTETDLVRGYENLEGVGCEIQVCSLLAHVWNELEHDLMYKPLTGDVSDAERQALESIGHLVRAGDVTITGLLTATNERLRQTQGPFKDQWDFVARTKDEFPASSDFGKHTGQLFEELMAQGLTTPEEIWRQLYPGVPAEERESVSREYLIQIRDGLESAGDAVVRLGTSTSDVLMVAFLAKHAQDVIERHPGGRGRGRPQRITSAAYRVRDAGCPWPPGVSA